jgi:hypothetical protein
LAEAGDVALSILAGSFAREVRLMQSCSQAKLWGGIGIASALAALLALLARGDHGNDWIGLGVYGAAVGVWFLWGLLFHDRHRRNARSIFQSLQLHGLTFEHGPLFGNDYVIVPATRCSEGAMEDVAHLLR